MACAQPPELDIIDLLMFLDNEADDQVVRHLAQCPHCQERVEELARSQNELRFQLYRSTCPSPELLGDYDFGLLSAEESANITKHLAHCPHCTKELVQLRSFLRSSDPISEVTIWSQIQEHVRVLVAQLLDAGAGALAPAYGLRNYTSGVDGDEALFSYQIDDIQIGLDVQEDIEQPDRRIISGLIMGVDTQGWQVHLWQDDLLVIEVVDDAGNFVIQNLSPGRYELILSGPDIKVQIPSLQIK
jgi:hypothetical protein